MALHIKYIIVSIVKYRILSYSRHGIKAVYALKVAYIYVYIIVCNISIGVYIIVQTYAYIDSIYSIYNRDRDVPTKWYIPVPVSLRRGVKGRPSLNSTPCRWGSLSR